MSNDDATPHDGDSTDNGKPTGDQAAYNTPPTGDGSDSYPPLSDSPTTATPPVPGPGGIEGTGHIGGDVPGAVPGEDGLVPANVDVDAKRTISRRRLFAVGAVGAGVVVAGGVSGWALLRGDKKDDLTVAQSWAGRELPITSPSGVCEAPLVIAYEKGFFKNAGLNVTLKKTSTNEAVAPAVSSGKYIATNGIFFNFLGPIYNGAKVKLSGGLHHGCLDLYSRNDGSIPTVAALKGKKIGVSDLQGSATNFFSLDLLDVGINSAPEAKQVEWVVIEQELLPEALKDKKVDAIATAGGFLPIIQGVKDGWAKELSNNDTISRNSTYPCCAVALNAEFATQDPVTAAKLVSAWSEGSRWVGANLEETAKILSEKKYVPDTPDAILPVLNTLTFDPSPRNLKEALLPGIEKFTKTGFLPAGTNAQTLADEVFVDLNLNF